MKVCVCVCVCVCVHVCVQTYVANAGSDSVTWLLHVCELSRREEQRSHNLPDE